MIILFHWLVCAVVAVGLGRCVTQVLHSASLEEATYEKLHPSKEEDEAEARRRDELRREWRGMELLGLGFSADPRKMFRHLPVSSVCLADVVDGICLHRAVQNELSCWSYSFWDREMSLCKSERHARVGLHTHLLEKVI